MTGSDIYGYPHKHPATLDDQKAAMAEHFGERLPTYYRCGGCESYHPDDYGGDCRNDLFRIADPDELHGPHGDDTWQEIDMNDESNWEVGCSRYGEELDGQLFDTTHEPADVDAIREELGSEWPEATGFMKTPEDSAGSPVQIWMTDDPTPWSSHASFIRVR